MLEHMADFRRGALVPCFEAMEAVMALVDDLMARNDGKAALDTRRWATRPALGLFGKARKSSDAMYLAARYGYGEDAMILARSLVNICIDLGYICRDPDTSEARARAWVARGRVGRRDFARRAAQSAPDEARVDWKEQTALSEEWKATSIFRRAELSGVLNFYNLPYRHGSVFEHSDSWGALSFVDVDATEVHIQTNPSENFVDLALLSASCALAQVAEDFGRFYAFNFGTAISDMDTAIRTGFPRDAASLPDKKA